MRRPLVRSRTVAFFHLVLITALSIGPTVRAETPASQPEPPEVKMEYVAAVDAVVASEAADLEVLLAALDAADDSAAALAIQKQIQDRKLRTELEFLRLQKAYRGAALAPEASERLDAAIASIESMLDLEEKTPVDRPTDEGR